MFPRPDLDRFQNPRYTGVNRCLPCTIVNLAIALAIGVSVGGFLTIQGVSSGLGVLVGGVLVVAGSLVVYFRGYLIPGTPELTKRYLPDSILRWFGKEPMVSVSDNGQIDPEAIFLEAGVLEECADSDDLCLTPGFESAWMARLDALEDTMPDELATTRDDIVTTPKERGHTTLDPGPVFNAADLSAVVPTADIQYDDRQTGFVAEYDGTRLAKWESRAAFLADMTAAVELEARIPDWDDLTFADRTNVLASLRLWLEQCPVCDSPVTMDHETVESCCFERQVLAATCDGCSSRLFEATVPEDVLEEATAMQGG